MVRCFAACAVQTIGVYMSLRSRASETCAMIMVWLRSCTRHSVARFSLRVECPDLACAGHVLRDCPIASTSSAQAYCRGETKTCELPLGQLIGWPPSQTEDMPLTCSPSMVQACTPFEEETCALIIGWLRSLIHASHKSMRSPSVSTQKDVLHFASAFVKFCSVSLSEARFSGTCLRYSV